MKKEEIRQQMKNLSHQCHREINESGARSILNGLEFDVVMQFGTCVVGLKVVCLFFMMRNRGKGIADRPDNYIRLDAGYL